MNMNHSEDKTIFTFWKNHPQYWFPKTDNEKLIADTEIYNRFYNFENIIYKSPICQIIYFDQFIRHFVRVFDSSVQKSTEKAYQIFNTNKSYFTDSKCEVEIVFGLMPLKHLKKFREIFEFIHCEWKNLPKKIKDLPILHRFYCDTYTKAYVLPAKKDISVLEVQEYNLRNSTSWEYSDIFDYFPETGITEKWKYEIPIIDLNDNLKNYLVSTKSTQSPIYIVSLSGGVDSMVLLTCLKKLLETSQLIATHIIYGNRPESILEADFLIYYCSILEIPLYLYEIPWIRRDLVEREYYESTTHDLRFFVYEWFQSKFPNSRILLGHIEEDLVENIWSNISKCCHIENLKKMDTLQIHTGPGGRKVILDRPLLHTSKETIYNISKILQIPYFKNTTPDWSQRGKFRNKFYEASKDQFGPNVHQKILQFSDIISSQSSIVDKLLYKPILESIEIQKLDKCSRVKCNITPALVSQIDENTWNLLFQKIFYKIGESKPSKKCIKLFYSKITTQINFRYIFKKNVEGSVNNGVLELYIIF